MLKFRSKHNHDTTQGREDLWRGAVQLQIYHFWVDAWATSVGANRKGSCRKQTFSSGLDKSMYILVLLHVQNYSNSYSPKIKLLN